MFDNDTFSQRYDDGDARVLALFRDWLAESRETDRLCDDEDQTEYEAAVARREAVANKIIATPGGAVALAIKAYLFVKDDACNAWAPGDATLRMPELFDGEPNGWCENIVVSILRDAAKQAPEIAELAAPILHEDASLIDADIDILWCRDRLAEDRTDRHVLTTIEVRQRLVRLLDRIAATEAKTARGEEIKLRHAPAIETERMALLAAEAAAAPPPSARTRRAIRALLDKWDAEAGEARP